MASFDMAASSPSISTIGTVQEVTKVVLKCLGIDARGAKNWNQNEQVLGGEFGTDAEKSDFKQSKRTSGQLQDSAMGTLDAQTSKDLKLGAVFECKL